MIVLRVFYSTPQTSFVALSTLELNLSAPTRQFPFSSEYVIELCICNCLTPFQIQRFQTDQNFHLVENCSPILSTGD